MNLFNKYLSTVSAINIMILSILCLVLPYIKINRNNILKPSNVKYVPGISMNVWRPILFFLIISICLYSIYLLRELSNLEHSIIFMVIVGMCLLYTIFGFILMLNYIDRAYKVTYFRIIMILLFLLSFIYFVPEPPTHAYSKKNLNILICICIFILMSLIMSEFKYYIK